MGGLSKTCGQVFFAAFVLGSLVLPWLMASCGQLSVYLAPKEKKEQAKNFLAKVVIVTTCICWRIAVASCFWISQQIEGVEELRKSLGNTGKPVCVIANHTSFLDILLSLTLMPLSQAGRFKMIVSSHVLKKPVIGRIATAMGHLAVPFRDTSATSTTFEVDREQIAEVMQSYEAHLTSGGCNSWFPEGQVNRGDCSKLQTFRAGGLEIAVRSDVEIWCIAFVGNAVSWPNGAPIGGYPAKIGGRCFCLCESSKEFLSCPDAGDTDRSKSMYMANTAQKKMQEVVDEFVAKGFVAGSNEKEKAD